MKERDLSLDAVKGFAIILVFLGHCLVWNNLSGTDPYLYDAIKSVQMPLFMMVSGYLAGMGKKQDHFLELCKVIGKRAVAYLLPFFVWPILLHPRHPFAEIKGILWQLDKGLWFFMTLFIVMVVTLVSHFIATKMTGQGEKSSGKRELMSFVVFGVVLLVFYAGFFIQSRSGFTFLSPSLTLSYLPYYAVGYVWTAYVKRLNLWKVADKVTWILWALAFLLFLFLVIGEDLQKMEGMTDLILQMCAGFLGCFVCFYGIYQIKNGKIRTALAKIGTITLELYIFQYAMHALFVKVRGLGDTQYSLYCLKGVMTVLVTFLIMCIVSAAGVWIIRRIPLLDALLFGHVNRLKKKHHE